MSNQEATKHIRVKFSANAKKFLSLMAEGYVEGTVCFPYISVSKQLLDQTHQYLA
jgi:hypothetical protein